MDIALPVSVPQIGDSALAVMQGNGDGTFQAPVVVNSGPFPTPTFLEAADFNNDRKPDLLWGVLNSGFSVFLGKGDGTFHPPTNTRIALGFGLSIADFTGDGKLDVACSGCGSSSVAVLPGKGDGTFGSPIVTNLPNSAGGMLYSADINGDGKRDLFLPGLVLLGNGDGTFQSPGLSISPQDLPGLVTAFGDFNKDGKLDIATATASANSGIASVAFGNGNGTFQFDTVVNTGASGGSPLVALADDFTGHGKTDLLEILGFNTLSPEFVVLPGNGNGTFKAPTTNVQIQSCGFQSAGLPECSAVAGKFKRNGKFDAAITGFNTSFPSFLPKVGIFLGNGDGTFQSEVDYSGGGTAIVLGDVNHDGITDIISGGDGTDNAYFMLGKGDGTFGFTTSVPISAAASSVAAADFNKDGNLDLAVGIPTGIAILPGNGKGTFGPEVDTPLAAAPTTLAVGDFKGNGNIDIVAGNSSSNVISVLLNTGGGSFSAPVPYAVLGSVVYVAVGDLNGDGIPDLVVLNSTSAVPSPVTDISILIGNGDGTFQPAVNFGVSDFSDTQFAIADLNGDGLPDIAAGSSLLFNRLDGVAATLSPTHVAFGNTAVGSTSAPQTVTLNNIGSLALKISGIKITGPQSSEFRQTNTCGTEIAPGAKCTIAITFTPAAIGSANATLNVTDNATHALPGVALSGTGVSLGLGASTPSATVSAGHAANYTLSVGGSGFSGTVTLACSGAPQGAKCTVPASESVNPTSASTFTATVTTTSATTAVGRPPSVLPYSGWLWAIALAGLAILPSSGSKRTARLLQVFPLLFFALLFNCSCGSGTSNCQACSNGTPQGKYTVTVTATSGSISQSTSLTLIVQ